MEFSANVANLGKYNAGVLGSVKDYAQIGLQSLRE